MKNLYDGQEWEFTYNADGLRTKRTNGTTTYNYVYYGGQLQYMEVNGSKMFLATAPDGTPMSIIYAGDAYYYMTNLQGDVVGITDTSGNRVVSYTYDAWGNPLTTTGSMADTLGQINPFRYRGYVYDSETGLYYLQSRYYDPEVGRFLNADAYTATGQGFIGNNMFAYCGNNPVNGCDPCGTCIHNLKFYDCKKCAKLWKEVKKGIANAWDNATDWCVEQYNTINNFHQQRIQLEMQITMEQNKKISNAAKAIGDAYERGYYLQQEAQHQNSAAFTEAYYYLKDNPKMAYNLSRDIASVNTNVYAVVELATAGGAPSAIAVAGVVALFAFIDLLVTVDDLVDDLG